MTPMRIRGLTHTPEAEQPVILLETPRGDLVLGFLIPPEEAARLARVVGLGRCRCVPVYDLLQDVVLSLDARVTRAVIDATARGIQARLVLERDGTTVTLPCHPADGLAAAVLAGAAIMATPAALARACPAGRHPPPEPGPTDLGRWLDGVRPEDFRAPGP